MLHVEPDIKSLKYIGIFEARTDDHKTGILAKHTCYSSAYTGKFMPDPGIDEMVCPNYKDRTMVSEVDQLIFDFLKEKGKLD